MTVVDNNIEAGEKGAKPAPVSFFDPSLNKVRRQVTRQWAQTLLTLCVFILGILSLYWAVQFGVEKKVTNLTVWVVDFDAQVEPYQSAHPIVGPIVTKVAQNIINSTDNRLGYTIKTPAEFNNDPLALRQSVYDQHAYAAIIVNPNATTLLRAAIADGNTTYDPTGAAQIIIVSARDQSTYASYILPHLYAFEAAVHEEFGPIWVQDLANDSTSALTKVPQAVNPAIGFSLFDLRPFGPAAAIPSVSIGLIYLIIIAFFNFPFMMPIHAQYLNGNHPPMKIPHWLIWRICSNLVAYFFLSLSYSLVSLAFQIHFSNPPAPGTVAVAHANRYGQGSFVVYWMLNWVGMCALGFPCENMGMILGFPWSSFFLIFWVITNVATGFYDLDLAPGFFKWGRAWPLHSIVEAARTILFDTHSRIGLDFGILFIWVAASIALFPFATLFMRWRMMKFGK